MLLKIFKTFMSANRGYTSEIFVSLMKQRMKLVNNKLKCKCE